MNDTIQWLLGLDRIRVDDAAPISLQFETPPAAWIMLFGAVISAIVVFLLYRRQEGPPGIRWLLGILRFGIIMSVLFICGRPLLVLSRIRTEPSFVGVLLDQSASMTISDLQVAGDASSPAAERWDAAIDAVFKADRGLLSTLGTRHEVGMWSFGRTAQRLGKFAEFSENPSGVVVSGEIAPTGDRTDIPRALRQVFDETLGRRVASLVLVSDGSQTELDELEPIFELARSRSVPVHVLAAGSSRPRRDLAMVSVWAPEDVFLRDTVSVRFDGTADAVEQPLELMIELRDEATGELIVSQPQSLAAGEKTFSGELQFAPHAKGRRGLIVRVVPLPDEEVVANNEARVSINANDEKIGVLYVEKLPRFEYRYLKNLLLREQNIDSSCMLLDASPGFPPEGTRPLRRFPDSIEQLGHYDVIILGDVDLRGNWIAPAQQAMLADYVSVQGAGIAFLAGEHFMPGTLERSPLEKLLPVEIDRSASSRSHDAITAEFLPTLTVDGRANPIFRLERDARVNEQTYGGMPGFYWFAKVARAQFGATILAVHPSVVTAGEPLPLAVLGRYGAGRTFFLGMDELWRWRQYSGDVYYESIWLQIIHTLARGRKLGLATPWRLETDRRRYDLGQEVKVKLTCSESAPPVRVSDPEILVKDAGENLAARLTLHLASGSDRMWEGAFVPNGEGSFVLSSDVPGPSLQTRLLTRAISVERNDPEMARRAANHEYLQRIAASTGGSFRLTSDDVSDLVELIPDRSVQIADDVEESIWDSRFMFAFLITLLLCEWTVRRWRGLA